jgi:hypothetical protein
LVSSYLSTSICLGVDNSSHSQYARITLTRYTTCYSFLVLVSCLVQITLQAATFSVNTQGVQMMSTILAEAKVRQGFPIIQDSTLCNVISGQPQQNLTFDAQATPSPVRPFLLSIYFSPYISHRDKGVL